MSGFRKGPHSVRPVKCPSCGYQLWLSPIQAGVTRCIACRTLFRTPAKIVETTKPIGEVIGDG